MTYVILLLEMKKGRCYVYQLEYHLIWCVKYRHQVLVGEVADGLKEILRDIAAHNGLEVITMEVIVCEVRITRLQSCEIQEAGLLFFWRMLLLS